MISRLTGRIAGVQGDRVTIDTAAGVGYEVVVPVSVLERLGPAGSEVTLATELVVRDDAWTLFGFGAETERRFFQRLMTVSGVGPKLALALVSALGLERGARALRDRDTATLASVSGVGKKTAERLVLELADKVGDFVDGGVTGAAPPPLGGGARAARQALERLGYSPAESDRAVRRALSESGTQPDADGTEPLVRRALQLLTHG
ncbi:MAG TPA: Holliday junction branch migration protein RuvA [bacterium]|nr:Holliday junction branch migration protein RuvA [bacterium]